ncbi:hypothetical protein DH2020_037228 [Rehmannia glutinosa]|uniref:TF-B3 domain-containing protein n=1 Tax=Rehmannia glutinosa TaxID=99300 RepID=A0ABR0V402_REHGL
MGRKPKSRPSFFKVMIKDFTSHMQLPPEFIRKYGEILPKITKLRTSSSGEAWNVELEKMEEENYCFTRGWTKFAKDVGVKLGEFLVFWFDIGKSTFDVSIYGISGCERQIPVGNSRIEGSDGFNRTCINLNTPLCMETGQKNYRSLRENAAAFADDDETKSDNSNPSFEIVMKQHRQSRVCVPRHFAEAAGLIGDKKVYLEYPGGHHGYVLLDFRPSKSNFKLDLARGWSNFRKLNGLAFGKTYLFEFIPRKKVIQVKQIKEKK